MLNRVFPWMLLCLLFPFTLGAEPQAVTPTAGAKDGAPRLLMVKIDRNQTAFFGLPEEMPVLLRAGEDPSAHLRHYDFNRGMQAMMIFLTLRPKDPVAPAYRRFLKKWPVYQSFFKAVERKDYAHARRDLDQIRTADPDEPAVRFYTGSLQTAMENYQAAEASYRSCIDVYTGYGPAYVNLARLARMRGDLEQARRYLETGLAEIDAEQQSAAAQTLREMLSSLEKK